jgi:hypothetical protein
MAKHLNNHNASYTYIDPTTLDPVLLTPFMMSEWAHTMVMFLTNIRLLELTFYFSTMGQHLLVIHRLSTTTFDLVNRKSSLFIQIIVLFLLWHSSNVYGISDDLAHLSHIISSVASITHTPSKPLTTPTHPHHTSLSTFTLLSPTWNMPSKLTQFLEYAEMHLIVENACLHEDTLQLLGFGPDILHLVDNTVLKDIGFTPGDVICLKQNLQQWWNSTDAKRKWTNDSPPGVQSTPPNKRVTFGK